MYRAKGEASLHVITTGVVCRDFIGRRYELDFLIERVLHPRAGRGSTLIVRGDAGIGKTRLIHELAAALTAHGVAPVIGNCYEFGDPPYAPLLEIAETLGAAGAAAALQSHAVAGDTASGRERTRRFAAFAAALAAGAKTKTVVAIVENLHWADSATLELFRFLSSALKDQRFTLLGTLRSEDIGRVGRAATQNLAEIERAADATVTLQALKPPEMRALLAAVESVVFVLAFRYLPLADTHAVAATSPLIVIALGVLFLGERAGAARWLAVGAGFVGVLLIVRPGFRVLDWPLVLPLLGAMMWGGYQILTRLSQRTDSPDTTLVWSAFAAFAATTLAAETGFDVHSWQLPWTMADFLDRRGYWHDCAALQRSALAAAARLGDTLGQAVAGRALGKACAWLTAYDQARVHLADSLRRYRQLGDRDGQARVHQSLNWVCERQARYGDALDHAEQALALFQALADQAGQAAALNAIGWCHVLLGAPEQARTFCQQALALNRERGNRRSEALTWDSLGYAEHQSGRLAEAAACYRRALSLFRECGDRFYEAEILTHLGDTRRAAGDPHEARAVWQEALDILGDLHHADANQVRVKLDQISRAPSAPSPVP